MPTLREARCIFTQDLGKLIEFAGMTGYEIALGECVRDPGTAKLNAATGKGIANSLHLLGLAADLHLYKDGRYMAATEDHKDLGAFWKSLRRENRWGGDFKKADGNHYSYSWDGRA